MPWTSMDPIHAIQYQGVINHPHHHSPREWIIAMITPQGTSKAWLLCHVGSPSIVTAATTKSVIITTYAHPPPTKVQMPRSVPGRSHIRFPCLCVHSLTHPRCPNQQARTWLPFHPSSHTSSFLGNFPRPRLLHTVDLFQLTDKMSQTEEKRPPLFVPRQIGEWKKTPDEEWLQQAGLFRYASHLQETINLHRCRTFIASMKARQAADPNNEEIAGVVDGVLVKYTPRYLHQYFGWDGTGSTSWTRNSPFPQPDTEACTRGYAAQRDKAASKRTGRVVLKYDVYLLTRRNSNLPDPWFGRIRGVLS
jgi:hypothetical protein